MTMHIYSKQSKCMYGLATNKLTDEVSSHVTPDQADDCTA